MLLSRHRKLELILPNGTVDRPAKFTKNTAKLNTPRAITREMARLYRSVHNGKVQIEAATRLVFILDKIGHRLDGEAQADPTQSGYRVDTIIVTGVPSGEMLSIEEIRRLESQFTEQPPAPVMGEPDPAA